MEYKGNNVSHELIIIDLSDRKTGLIYYSVNFVDIIFSATKSFLNPKKEEKKRCERLPQ
jgi:hypothetical protein